jgi:polar amino acid transport system substrate-binding protein
VFKTIIRTAVAAVTALALIAPAASARSLEQIIASGVLRVGTYPDQPPMASLNDSGEFEGFDIDVANHIAEIMNVRLEIVPVTTAQRIPFLQSGQIDISLGALTRTPARALLVDFTIPLHSESVMVLTTEGNDIESWRDLNASGQTLAAGRGYWTTDFVAGALPEAGQILLDAPADQVRAVAQGRATAIVDIIDTMMVFTEQYPNVQWRVLETDIYSAWCAIGVPRGEHALRNFLNVVLYDMHRTGLTQEMWTRWYGAPNPLPVPLSPVF